MLSSACCASQSHIAHLPASLLACPLACLPVCLSAGVISWKECLNNNAAWDTLTWFAALIAMAAYLNKVSLIVVID